MMIIVVAGMVLVNFVVVEAIRAIRAEAGTTPSQRSLLFRMGFLSSLLSCLGGGLLGTFFLEFDSLVCGAPVSFSGMDVCAWEEHTTTSI